MTREFKIIITIFLLFFFSNQLSAFAKSLNNEIDVNNFLPYTSGTLQGTVSTKPIVTKGGHVFFSLVVNNVKIQETETPIARDVLLATVAFPYAYMYLIPGINNYLIRPGIYKIYEYFFKKKEQQEQEQSAGKSKSRRRKAKKAKKKTRKNHKKKTRKSGKKKAKKSTTKRR